ncbi:MAG: hypothetical protein EOP73_08200 [Variovorax sp.]|nr:MAG: hypothetical protein EOP73_08200 [Variovorax sp.]
MSALTLNLAKPGDAKPKLSLNLSKDEIFVIKLKWDGDADLDLHALACIGQGGEAPTITSLEQILSPYNVIRRVGGQQQGSIPKAADGSFSILGGAMTHSPDATDGALTDVDEWIRVAPGKLPKAPGQVVEIPIIAMIHPQKTGVSFAHVQNPEVVIENAEGVVLMHAHLSQQFGAFIGVQMGSIMIDEHGRAEFVQTAAGFSGDFNTVIENFS